MANEIRFRQNFISGVVDDNPLTLGATTLNSTALTALDVIDSTNHAVIVLDPDGADGDPEIIYVTAHTASASSATVVRGREGTSARAHNQNTIWRHGPIVSDFGGSAKDVLWTPQSGATPVDEFNDSTIDAAYTSLLIAGSATWVEDGDMLGCKFSGQGGAQFAYQLRAIGSSGFAIGKTLATAVDTLGDSGYAMAALVLADGTAVGSNAMLCTAWYDGGLTTLGYRSGVLNNCDSVGSSFSQSYRVIGRLHLGWEWVASNTFLPKWSINGFQWSSFVFTNISRTFTPTHFGVGVSAWTGSGGLAGFEYLRVL